MPNLARKDETVSSGYSCCTAASTLSWLMRRPMPVHASKWPMLAGADIANGANEAERDREWGMNGNFVEPDDVDPGVRTFLDRVGQSYAQAALPIGSGLAERRALAERVRQPWTIGGPEMANVEERNVGATRIRILRPDTRRVLPGLIYIHGGGWTIFSLDTHDRLMREYASRAGVAVIGVDYSLSPEVRFPHALEEIEAVVEWLLDDIDSGIDPRRIAIGGDSAGANLALATSLRMREKGRPPLSGMILNYGAFDWLERASHRRYGGERYMLTPTEMEEFWSNYVADADRANPHARVAVASFVGLPPTFLCIAECDILADENRLVADRLTADGVDVTAKVYPGATHSFLEAVSVAPLADLALSDASAWLTDLMRDGINADG